MMIKSKQIKQDNKNINLIDNNFSRNMISKYLWSEDVDADLTLLYLMGKMVPEEDVSEPALIINQYLTTHQSLIHIHLGYASKLYQEHIDKLLQANNKNVYTQSFLKDEYNSNSTKNIKEDYKHTIYQYLTKSKPTTYIHNQLLEQAWTYYKLIDNRKTLYKGNNLYKNNNLYNNDTLYKDSNLYKDEALYDNKESSQYNEADNHRQDKANLRYTSSLYVTHIGTLNKLIEQSTSQYMNLLPTRMVRGNLQYYNTRHYIGKEINKFHIQRSRVNNAVNYSGNEYTLINKNEYMSNAARISMLSKLIEQSKTQYMNLSSIRMVRENSLYYNKGHYTEKEIKDFYRPNSNLIGSKPKSYSHNQLINQALEYRQFIYNKNTLYKGSSLYINNNLYKHNNLYKNNNSYKNNPLYKEGALYKDEVLYENNESSQYNEADDQLQDKINLRYTSNLYAAHIGMLNKLIQQSTRQYINLISGRWVREKKLYYNRQLNRHNDTANDDRNEYMLRSQNHYYRNNNSEANTYIQDSKASSDLIDSKPTAYIYNQLINQALAYHQRIYNRNTLYKSNSLYKDNNSYKNDSQHKDGNLYKDEVLYENNEASQYNEANDQLQDKINLRYTSNLYAAHIGMLNNLIQQSTSQYMNLVSVKKIREKKQYYVTEHYIGKELKNFQLKLNRHTGGANYDGNEYTRIGGNNYMSNGGGANHYIQGNKDTSNVIKNKSTAFLLNQLINQVFSYKNDGLFKNDNLYKRGDLYRNNILHKKNNIHYNNSKVIQYRLTYETLQNNIDDETLQHKINFYKKVEFLKDTDAPIVYKSNTEKQITPKPAQEIEPDIEFKKVEQHLKQTEKNSYKTIENTTENQVIKNDIRMISDTTINQITNKVYNQIVKKLKMEQLKRGL